MPLHDAHYFAGTDKIYGVMENYILQFNATTGSKENSAKICAPCYGPMRITGDASMLFVSSVNDFSRNRTDVVDLPTTNKQIWTVHPTTLAASNLLLLDDRIQVSFGGSTDVSYPHWGPRALKVVSGYIYFVYVGTNGGYSLYRINILNPADYEILPPVSSAGASHQYAEMFDVYGTKVYLPEPDTSELLEMHIDALNPFTVFVTDASPSVAPYYPVACAYVPATDCCYVLSGSEIMHRWDVGGAAMSTLNLGTVWSSVKPMRMRLSPLDGKLYIPCQNEDVIIVWDPTLDTGIVKTGFDSPIDVVFTGSKTWAVQTASYGLLEVT